jgi:hypothetical protein
MLSSESREGIYPAIWEMGAVRTADSGGDRIPQKGRKWE